MLSCCLRLSYWEVLLSLLLEEETGSKSLKTLAISQPTSREAEILALGDFTLMPTALAYPLPTERLFCYQPHNTQRETWHTAGIQ